MSLRTSLVFQRLFPLVRFLIPVSLRKTPSLLTRAENMVAVLLLAIVVLPSYGVLYLILNDPLTGYVCFLAMGGVLLSSTFLRYAASVPLARETFALTLYAMLLVLIYRTGGIASPSVLWLSVCPVITSTTGGVVAGRRWAFAVVPTIAVIYALDAISFFPSPVVHNMRMVGCISVLSFIMVMAFFLLVYERINSTAIRKLDHALGLIRTLAIHDELTGVVNRREVLRVASQEKYRTGSKGLPFCLCLMDVDHFKNINDSFGHMVGDEVLRRIASKIKNEIRGTDCFGRYGGEEFLLVLTATDLSGAAELVERIRQSVAEMHLTELGGQAVTISIGIAQNRDHEAIEHTLSRADKALYAAKASGRNRLALDEAEEVTA
jgi:diguanylate cyclase (GGDEF)-like protein